MRSSTASCLAGCMPVFVFLGLIGLPVGTDANTLHIYNSSTCENSSLITETPFDQSSCVQPQSSVMIYYKMNDDHCVDGSTPKVKQYDGATCAQSSQTGRVLVQPGENPGTDCLSTWVSDGMPTFYKISGGCQRIKCSTCECECGPNSDSTSLVGTYESLSPSGVCSTSVCETSFPEACTSSGSRGVSKAVPTRDCDSEDSEDDYTAGPPAFTCSAASGKLTKNCFDSLLKAQPEGVPQGEGCVIDTVKADFADCFAVNGCCDVDFNVWIAFLKKTLPFASCTFPACAEVVDKVAFTVRLSYSKAAFDDDTNSVQTNYMLSIAAAAGTGISKEDVSIIGTTAQTVRRRLLADAVDVATEVRTGSPAAASSAAAAMTQEKLNEELVARGLTTATITTAAEVKVVSSTDAAAHAVPSLLMALGAVMVSLALLF
eukprot:2861016-Rhodomonas_salina.1